MSDYASHPTQESPESLSDAQYQSDFTRSREEQVLRGFLPAGSGLRNPQLPTGGSTYGVSFISPRRDQFANEKDYYRAHAQSFVFRNMPHHNMRLALMGSGIDIVTSTTQGAKAATYASPAQRATQISMQEMLFNALSGRISILHGEWVSRKYKAAVVMPNRRMTSRYSELYGQLFWSKVMNDALGPELAQRFDPELIDYKAVMGAFEGSVSEWMTTNYRDTVEVVAQRIIDDLLSSQDFDGWLKQMYYYWLMTETANSCPEVDPQTFRTKLPLIHPEGAVPDYACNDDYFTNGYGFLRYRYESVESILMRFPDIRREQISNATTGTSSLFGLPTTRLWQGTYNEVLVAHYWFRDVVEIEHECRTTENPRIEMENGRPAYREDVQEKKAKGRIEQLHYCCLVAGDVVAEYGRSPFEVRTKENPAAVALPSCSAVHGRSVRPDHPSRVNMVTPLVKARAMAIAKLIDLVESVQGAYIEYDKGIIENRTGDATGDLINFMAQVKSTRMIPRPTDAAPGQPTLRVVDFNGDMGTINNLMGYVVFLSQQIDENMTINPARTGQVGQYLGKEVGQAAKTQSDFGTAPAQMTFERFIEQTLLKWLMLEIKCVRALRERSLAGDAMARQSEEVLRIRYGDEAMQLSLEELNLLDLGIKIERKVNEAEQAAGIREAGLLMVQQGTPPELVRLYKNMVMTDNPEEMSYALDRELAKMEAKQAEAQQAAAAQQAEMQAASQQQASDLASQQAAQQNDARLTQEGLKAEAALEQERLRQEGRMRAEQARGQAGGQ
jgi:hypothetical protein